MVILDLELGKLDSCLVLCKIFGATVFFQGCHPRHKEICIWEWGKLRENGAIRDVRPIFPYFTPTDTMDFFKVVRLG